MEKKFLWLGENNLNLIECKRCGDVYYFFHTCKRKLHEPLEDHEYEGKPTKQFNLDYEEQD